jgi:hypothetical protein
LTPTVSAPRIPDEYCYGDVPRCVAILRDAVHARRNFTFAIVPEAGHGFGGREGELGRLMGEWVGERVEALSV